MVFNVLRELEDLAAGRRAVRVLQEGTVPPDAAVALDARARDLLAVFVPPLGVNGADAVGEPVGDATGDTTRGRSSTVDPEPGDEVRQGGEDE